jgi:TonB family protein
MQPKHNNSFKTAKITVTTLIFAAILYVTTNSFASHYTPRAKQADTSLAFKKALSSLYRHLGTTIRYPRLARENSTTGAVVVSFKLNDDGKIQDVTILQSIKDGCDEEVKNTLLTFNDKNKQIKSGNYKIAVIFRFEGQPIPTVDASLKKDPNYLNEIVITAMLRTSMRQY